MSGLFAGDCVSDALPTQLTLTSGTGLGAQTVYLQTRGCVSPGRAPITPSAEVTVVTLCGCSDCLTALGTDTANTALQALGRLEVLTDKQVMATSQFTRDDLVEVHEARVLGDATYWAYQPLPEQSILRDWVQTITGRLITRALDTHLMRVQLAGILDEIHRIHGPARPGTEPGPGTAWMFHTDTFDQDSQLRNPHQVRLNGLGKTALSYAEMQLRHSAMLRAHHGYRLDGASVALMHAEDAYRFTGALVVDALPGDNLDVLAHLWTLAGNTNDVTTARALAAAYRASVLV